MFGEHAHETSVAHIFGPRGTGMPGLLRTPASQPSFIDPLVPLAHQA